MSKEKDLAAQIWELNDSVRRMAIEAGEEDDVGIEVSKEEVLNGVYAAGFEHSSQILDDMLDVEPEDHDFDLICDNFCDWMNEFVYKPILNDTLDGMIKDGVIEMTGMDRNGEFLFTLTEKGQRERENRK